MKQCYCALIAEWRGLVQFTYFSELWGQKKISREGESFPFLLSSHQEHVCDFPLDHLQPVPVLHSSELWSLLVKLLMSSAVFMQHCSLTAAVKSLCSALFRFTCCVRSIPRFTMDTVKTLSLIAGPDLVLISVWSHGCNRCASPWTSYSSLVSATSM